jgi:hypothetical protein
MSEPPLNALPIAPCQIGASAAIETVLMALWLRDDRRTGEYAVLEFAQQAAVALDLVVDPGGPERLP